jgi:hypothetical protein
MHKDRQVEDYIDSRSARPWSLLSQAFQMEIACSLSHLRASIMPLSGTSQKGEGATKRQFIIAASKRSETRPNAALWIDFRDEDSECGELSPRGLLDLASALREFSAFGGIPAPAVPDLGPDAVLELVDVQDRVVATEVKASMLPKPLAEQTTRQTGRIDQVTVLIFERPEIDAGMAWQGSGAALAFKPRPGVWARPRYAHLHILAPLAGINITHSTTPDRIPPNPFGNFLAQTAILGPPWRSAPVTYGAFQPYRRLPDGKREKDGDLILDCFPAAIDFKTFEQVQDARKCRYRKPLK